MTLEHTALMSSVYVHLTGHASQIDVDLSALTSQNQGPSLLGLSSPNTADTSVSRRPTLTVPAPLNFGASIQLQELLSDGRVADMPFYAVSEELALNMDCIGACPHQSLLESTLVPMSPYMLTCPAAHMETKQNMAAQQGTAAAEPVNVVSTSDENVIRFSAMLPWALSVCLLLSTIGLAANRRQLVSTHCGNPRKQSGAGHPEPSHARSNQELITPTKDTGCSPFIPVTQAGVPQLPFGSDYMGSCSSKIGSHTAARPARSKAFTNTTCVSGHTKWQRNKNGRLLSLALDPDEHTS